MAKDLLKEEIYQFLTEKIQSKEFSVGDKLSEVPIANALGVSRTPVREALNQLAFEGFITKIPYRGFFIKMHDLNKAMEVYETIAYVDSAVAVLACPFMHDIDYRKMSEIIAKINIAIEFENFIDYSNLQIAFHNIYADKCKNQFLKDTLYSLKFSHVPHTYMSKDKDVFKAYSLNNEEHNIILEAFKQKDLILLEKVIRSHWTYIVDEKLLFQNDTKH